MQSKELFYLIIKIILTTGISTLFGMVIAFIVRHGKKIKNSVSQKDFNDRMDKQEIDIDNKMKEQKVYIEKQIVNHVEKEHSKIDLMFEHVKETQEEIRTLWERSNDKLDDILIRMGPRKK